MGLVVEAKADSPDRLDSVDRPDELTGAEVLVVFVKRREAGEHRVTNGESGTVLVEGEAPCLVDHDQIEDAVGGQLDPVTGDDSGLLGAGMISPAS